MTKKSTKKSTKIGLYLIAELVCYFALGFAIRLIPDNMRSVNFNYLFGQLSIALPLILYIAITKGQALRDIPFRRIKVENIIIIVLFSWICMPVTSFLNAISMLFATNHVAASVNSLTENMFFVNLLVIAVLPAILEEIAYRGVLFYGLREYGVIAAVIMSGLLFGLGHMNLNQFVYACALGMVMALLDEASGSIFASMVMHFVFNVNSVIVIEIYKWMPYLEKIAAENGQNPAKQQDMEIATDLTAYPLQAKILLLGFYGLLSVIAVVVNTKIFIWYAKRNGRWEHIKEEFRNTKAGFSATTKGRIISIPMVIVMFISVFYMVLDVIYA